jgi:hypothetical protein
MWLYIGVCCVIVGIRLVEAKQTKVNFAQKTEIDYQLQRREFYSTSTLGDSLIDHYFIIRSTWQVDPSPFLGFEFQPEMRVLSSEGRGLQTLDPAYLDLPVADRYFSADLGAVKSENFIATLNFERINAVYRFNEGSFLVGRRPVSLGNLRTLIILNKFAANSLSASGYPFYFGQDGATWTYAFDSHQFRAISILAEYRARDVHLLEWKFSGEGFEFQAIGGSWWNKMAYGVAPTVDLAEGSLRFELLNVPDEKLTQAGLGYERALGESFKFTFESLYQSLGSKNAGEITLVSPSSFMLFRSQIIGLLQGEYTGFQFWNIALGVARSFSDESVIGSARIQYALSDHFDVYVDSRWPFTTTRGEFSTYTIDLPGGGRFGQSAFVSFGVKAFF